MVCLCRFIYLPLKRNICCHANCRPIWALVRVKASILSSKTHVCVFSLQEMATGRDCYHDGWATITINSCWHSGSTPDSQEQQQQQRIVLFRMRECTGCVGGGCQRAQKCRGRGRGGAGGVGKHAARANKVAARTVSAITSQLLRRRDDGLTWTSFSHSPAITMETRGGSGPVWWESEVGDSCVISTCGAEALL